jgi:cation transport ATPase
VRFVREPDREAARQAARSESASVNFATKVATVKYDPAATGPEKLAKAVDDIGYKAVVPAVRLGTVNPAARARGPRSRGDARGAGTGSHAGHAMSGVHE